MYANVMVNPWLKHWFIGDVDVDVPNIQHMLKSTVHTCQFQQTPVCVRISLLSTRLSWLDLELSVAEVWLAAVDAMFSFDGVIENVEACWSTCGLHSACFYWQTCHSDIVHCLIIRQEFLCTNLLVSAWSNMIRTKSHQTLSIGSEWALKQLTF